MGYVRLHRANHWGSWLKAADVTLELGKESYPACYIMLPFVTTPRTGLKNGDQQTSACSHPGHFPAFTCHFLEIPGCNKGKCGYVHFSWSRSHFKARQRLQVKCSAENRNSGATGLLALRKLWEILQLRFFRMGHFTPYGPLTNWALESTDLGPSEPTILGWSLKVGFMVGDRMSWYNDRKIMHTYHEASFC